MQLMIWDNVKEPKAVLQIAHGLSEDMSLYAPSAEYFNEAGLIVVGHDMRTGSDAGNFGDSVEDLILVNRLAKEKFPNLPVILLGYSYGSLLAQMFIQKAACEISGAILLSTACLNDFKTKLQRKTCNTGARLKGAHKPCKRFGCEMSYGFFKSMYAGLKRIYNAEGLSSIPKELPILIACGDKDWFGNYGKSCGKLYRTYIDAALKAVSIKIYPDGGHVLLRESRKDEVMADIKEFVFSVI